MKVIPAAGRCCFVYVVNVEIKISVKRFFQNKTKLRVLNNSQTDQKDHLIMDPAKFELVEKIKAQGDVVRKLKEQKAALASDHLQRWQTHLWKATFML
jgi:hypothetical protein